MVGTCLKVWLASLQERGFSIVVGDHGPYLAGELRAAIAGDGPTLRRHLHALGVAAAGTNAVWWRHVIDPDCDEPLTLDDIPTSPIDPDAFACATDGSPAMILDSQLLAWCDVHKEFAV